MRLMHRSIMIRYAVWIVFFFFFMTQPAKTNAGDLDDLKKRGVLRHLGIPYANFVTGSGDGLDVDIMKLFADHLGVRYEHIQTSWPTVIGDLTGLQVKVKGNDVEIIGKSEIKGDAIANGFTVLPWREKVLNFSTPTFPTQVWLIAKAEAPIRPILPSGNLEKDIQAVKTLLTGKTTLDMPNTCLDASLYNLSAIGVTPVHFTGSLNDLAPALIDGKAELLLLDVADTLVALDKWPQKIKVIGPLSEPQTMGIGFAKSSPELLKAFNNYFTTIRNDGTYKQLVKKYYPQVFVYFDDFF